MGAPLLAACAALIAAALQAGPAQAPSAAPAQVLSAQPVPAPLPATASSTPAEAPAPGDTVPLVPAAVPGTGGAWSALSLPALASPPKGHLSLGLGADFYRGGSFLLPDSTVQRTLGSLAFSLGLASWLEVFGAAGLRAASAASGPASRSLSSVGDLDLGAKATVPLAGPLSAGLLLQVDLPAGIGAPSLKGLGGRALALLGAALRLGPVPLAGALVAGYALDNSARLLDGRVATLPAFALDVSLYDRAIAGASLQAPFAWGAPALELVLEAPVARETPVPEGAGGLRARLLLGATGVALGAPGLRASAGLQLSLTRAGLAEPASLAVPGWAPDPPWALRLGLSWTFEPRLPQRARELRWKEQPLAPAGGPVAAAPARPEAPPEPPPTPIEPLAPDRGRLVLLLLDGRTQQPVAGAWVSLLESPELEATSGADGRARLEVAPGSLTLAVAKDGFEPATQAVTAVAGQERLVQLQLQPLQADCTLRGRVVGDQGEPLRATLTLSLHGTPRAERRLFEGSYSLPLLHGTWRVVAAAPGYHGEPVELELLPGETRARDLVLRRMAGEPLARATPEGAEVGRRVPFAPGRGQLSPLAAGPLGDLAVALRGLDAPLVVGVRVEPADLGASADDAVAALKLGEERARAVVDFLAGQGVPRALLVPRGLGLARPGQPTLELKRATGGGGRPRSLAPEER